MNNKPFSLGARLAACAGYVRKGSRVADIGTDHALLPVWLVLNGIASGAVASDVNTGPIERARENIEKYASEGRIRTVVADGLSGLSENEADDIIIAGMGGELIAGILDGCEWIKSNDCRLILQPMTKADRLRGYLFGNGFEIEDETAVEDSGRLYTVMCVSFSGKGITDREDLALLVHTGCLLGKTAREAEEYLERHAKSLLTESKGLERAGDRKKSGELKGIAERILLHVKKTEVE